jgi:hypothetical protein
MQTQINKLLSAKYAIENFIYFKISFTIQIFYSQQQGDYKVPEFIDAMTPFNWETIGMRSSNTHDLPLAKISLLWGILKFYFKYASNISIYKTSDKKEI